MSYTSDFRILSRTLEIVLGSTAAICTVSSDSVGTDKLSSRYVVLQEVGGGEKRSAFYKYVWIIAFTQITLCPFPLPSEDESVNKRKSDILLLFDNQIPDFSIII